MSGEDVDEAKEQAGRSKLRTMFILSFSCLWLIGLIAGWVIPSVGHRNDDANKVLKGIWWSTGTRQEWEMFRTIPLFGDFHVELVGETASGEQRTFGPIGPELGELDGHRSIRYHYGLVRLLGNPEFREGYVRQSAAALRGLDPEVEKFSIHTLSEATRVLDRIRDDGEIWAQKPEVFGPYPIADD